MAIEEEYVGGLATGVAGVEPIWAGAVGELSANPIKEEDHL